MQTLHIVTGRIQEVISTLSKPECAAYMTSGLIGENATIKVWPSRAALMTTLRLQAKREPRPNDWHPVIKGNAY